VYTVGNLGPLVRISRLVKEGHMKLVWNAVATAVLGAAAGMTAAAQGTPALLSVSRIQVKPERMSEFLEVQKKITEAYKKGGATLRVVLRGSLGNPNEVMTVSGMNNYADRDNMASPVRKAMTDAEWAALFARRDQCVVSVRTTIEQTLPELGIAPSSGTVLPKMFREVRTMVRPGMAEQYMALVKSELVPVYKKLGYSYIRVRRVQYGGSRTEFSSAWGFEKWADLDTASGALQKTMGDDAYRKYMEKAASLVSNSQYLIWTVVADASFRNQ
jgi:hypothetical protein